MPRIAIKLTPALGGGYTARKRIPADVSEAYAKLYSGIRSEEWFNSGPMPLALARARHREWSSAIESRIANIRAERSGDGRSLTPADARALAAEWYAWFIARKSDHGWSAQLWDGYAHELRSELYGPAMAVGVFDGDPLDVWDTNSEMRDRVRPMVADWSESSQFLAAKRMKLDTPSRDMFIDSVVRDFFAALARLARRAQGGRDEFTPRYEAPGDTSLTPWSLFERWVAEAQPATSTIDRWRSVFLKLQADFPTASAAALLPEQMQSWAKGLINDERSARTVRDVWAISCRTVWAWGIGQKLLARNPFTGWRLTVPRAISKRDSKAFTTDEANAILSSAAAIIVRTKTEAAKRWMPWLAAYSGARMGEVAQLRVVDVIERDGVHAIKISPEAGTTKTGKARVVPLHGHLVEQGFLDFVKASGKGALFYNEAAERAPNNPTNPRKPRYVKAREHVAAWVRAIGINDPELQPNHAWRHTFKAVGHRCGMSEKVIDAICGHAPASVGRSYGEPTLGDKATELAKFPRYLVGRIADSK